MKIDRYRRYVYCVLEEPRQAGWVGLAVNIFLFVVLIFVAAVVVFETMGSLQKYYDAWGKQFYNFVFVLFLVEYLARLWVSVENPRFAKRRFPRLSWALSPMALVDLFALVSVVSGFEFSAEIRVVRLATLIKFQRYFGVLNLFNQALRLVAPSFFVSIGLLCMLLIFAATGAFIFEREAQPEAFASIPHSMWWAVATLTTVGYGDVYPVTAGGRVFGGIAMVVGVGFAALPAGLFASAMNDVVNNRRSESRELAEIAMITAQRFDDEYLRQLRREYPLSMAELRNVARHAEREHAKINKRCPHCGEPIE